jgi:hypothetical protein
VKNTKVRVIIDWSKSMSIIRKCTSYLKERNYIPRLTVKGIIIYCTNSMANISERKFDWIDALIDAVIISGLTFFSTFGGGSVAGLSIVAGFKAATIAACAQFFVFLALKRGIVQPKQAPV